VEPAGNTCLCIVNTLHQVHVDTASSSPSQNNCQHDLTIAGLHNPQAFKKLVWAMKRANNVVPSAPRGNTVLDRGLAAAETNPSSSEDVATLLRDIRDELRQHNEALRGIQHQNNDAASSSSTTSNGDFV
jgi:hypothetical protein